MTSRIPFGGWLYPDAPSFATAAELTFARDDLDCAAMGTDVKQATTIPTKKHVKAFCAGISSLLFNTLEQDLSGAQAGFY
jgi:hypothetical protein